MDRLTRQLDLQLPTYSADFLVAEAIEHQLEVDSVARFAIGLLLQTRSLLAHGRGVLITEPHQLPNAIRLDTTVIDLGKLRRSAELDHYRLTLKGGRDDGPDGGPALRLVT